MQRAFVKEITKGKVDMDSDCTRQIMEAKVKEANGTDQVANAIKTFIKDHAVEGFEVPRLKGPRVKIFIDTLLRL